MESVRLQNKIAETKYSNFIFNVLSGSDNVTWLCLCSKHIA